jgi:hypothetical protein
MKKAVVDYYGIILEDRYVEVSVLLVQLLHGNKIYQNEMVLLECHQLTAIQQNH